MLCLHMVKITRISAEIEQTVQEEIKSTFHSMNDNEALAALGPENCKWKFGAREVRNKNCQRADFNL